MTNTDRSLPHNLEAEKALLGSIIRDIEAALTAQQILPIEALYQPSHQTIFRIVLEMVFGGIPVDLQTLSAELEKCGELKNVGGPGYIYELVDGVPSSANIEHYAGIVRDRWLRRCIIRQAHDLTNEAFNSIDDAEVIADRFYKNYLDNKLNNSKPLTEISSFLGDVVESIQIKIERAKNGHVQKEIPFGFPDLDSLTGGMDRGEMIVLAARPSEGKTALLVGIADNVARKGKTVAFFSLEMQSQQIATRVICQRCKIPYHSTKLRDFSREDSHKLFAGLDESGKLPIYIDDTSAISVESIFSKAQRQKISSGLDLVIIDYLQLIGCPDKERFGLREKIAHISHSIKSIAKRLNCPVLVASQLSRECEKQNREPQMSDLRESGDIEQDADSVIFLFRSQDIEKKDTGPRIIKVDKNRNGPTGRCELRLIPQYMRFESMYDDKEPF